MEPKLSSMKEHTMLSNGSINVKSARSSIASILAGPGLLSPEETEPVPCVPLVNPKETILCNTLYEYSQGLNTETWRFLFLPKGLADLVQRDMHVIGPSHCPSLFEVAVSPGWGKIDNYEDIPGMPPVPIELSVADGKLFEFLSNAAKGIFQYGHGLGQYYRERYPKLRTWTEYFILLYDLRVSLLLTLS